MPIACVGDLLAPPPQGDAVPSLEEGLVVAYTYDLIQLLAAELAKVPALSAPAATICLH